MESRINITGFNVASAVSLVQAYVSDQVYEELAPTVAPELSETDKGLRDLVHEAMLMVHHTQQAALAHDPSVSLKTLKGVNISDVKRTGRVVLQQPEAISTNDEFVQTDALAFSLETQAFQALNSGEPITAMRLFYAAIVCFRKLIVACQRHPSAAMLSERVKAYQQKVQECEQYANTSADRGKLVLKSDLPNKIRNKEYAIPGFEILDIVGEGACGLVMKVRQEEDGMLMAAKVQKNPRDTVNGNLQSMTEREAMKLASIRSDHCVRYQRMPKDSLGNKVMMLEYVEGGTDLTKVMTQKKKEAKEQKKRMPMPVEEIFEISRQLTVGLTEVHKKGLIHRDIKPDNIMRVSENTYAISDFGLAIDADKVHLEEDQAGTPLYMSLGAYTGDVYPKDDVYALGLVLYELLTGKGPESAMNFSMDFKKKALTPTLIATTLSAKTLQDENFCVVQKIGQVKKDGETKTCLNPDFNRIYKLIQACKESGMINKALALDEYLNLISSMTCQNLELRPSSEEVLAQLVEIQHKWSSKVAEENEALKRTMGEKESARKKAMEAAKSERMKATEAKAVAKEAIQKRNEIAKDRKTLLEQRNQRKNRNLAFGITGALAIGFFTFIGWQVNQAANAAREREEKERERMEKIAQQEKEKKLRLESISRYVASIILYANGQQKEMETLVSGDDLDTMLNQKWEDKISNVEMKLSELRERMKGKELSADQAVTLSSQAQQLEKLILEYRSMQHFRDAVKAAKEVHMDKYEDFVFTTQEGIKRKLLTPFKKAFELYVEGCKTAQKNQMGPKDQVFSFLRLTESSNFIKKITEQEDSILMFWFKRKERSKLNGAFNYMFDSSREMIDSPAKNKFLSERRRYIAIDSSAFCLGYYQNLKVKMEDIEKSAKKLIKTMEQKR